MKSALLLTNSADSQRLFTETIGDRTNFVLLPAPTEPAREKFDALFATWLRLVDAVIVDAVSLGETSRWALESLAAARLQEHQAVVVRTTASQQSMYPTSRGWLIVTDTDSAEQLKQSLGTFFDLRETQNKLKRADAMIARQRQPAAPPSAAPPPTRAPVLPIHSSSTAVASFDSYRYRDALKNISRLLGQRLDRQSLLTEFLKLMREFLGVGKLAIFTRPLQSDLFENEPMVANPQLAVAASAGIASQVVELLRLTLDSGLGAFLSTEARILRRTQLFDGTLVDYDGRIAHEFELLGTEVAVPMFDTDQLLGVLTFNGKITGEAFTNEELELVYHLLAQLTQAIHNLHLQERISNQQRLVSEVLAHVQTGVVVVGHDSRILSFNQHARELLEVGEQDIVGEPIARLPSRVADVVFEALQTGQEIHEREVTLPPQSRPLGVSATRFVEEDTGSFVAVALIEDLTQVKLQQAHARELADREFFTRLSSRLSHELKNSLVSIKIFAQLLPERHTEKEFREQFSTVVTNEVNRVDVLVNNLTFFSHPLGLVSEEVVLSDLIDVCLRNVSQEFARKKLAQVVSVGEKAPEAIPGVAAVVVKKNFAHKFARLEGDKLRLMQAFEHVLRNAVQSMPTGGRLTVSTSDAQPTDLPDGKIPAGGAVRIEWHDSGEGIALEDLRRVTEPFVTTRNVGVGLGLTIVKKIVERHSGRLEIDSLLGRGTTVVMVLPVKAQPHPEDALLAHIAKHTGDLDEDGGHATASSRVSQEVDEEHGGRSS
jgi:two-component system nitrogen regulation sensor histidine kinase GlnL